uniref:ribosomal protein S19 n=1 Tax=Hydnora esculenta TaxID=1851369 RepID=UPI002113921D|nr:ribosomal protein S19 [Hydnora esculenta]USN93646.1 ribosomal protein S19 [Hydnora esculenta]
MKDNIFIHSHILDKLTKVDRKKDKTIKTWSRSSTIIPNMIGRIFSIYNGRFYRNLRLTKFMVGHKIGEFVPTLKFLSHKEKKKKKTFIKKKKSYKLTSAPYKPTSKRRTKPKRYFSKKKTFSKAKRK